MSKRELTSRGFSWHRAVQYGLDVLNRPPALPWIERPTPRGHVLAVFGLPLVLCPTGNETRKKPDWWYSRLREEQFLCMLPAFLQSGLVREKILPGRPQVHAIRFAPASSDAVADFAKGAIDRLISPVRGWRKHRKTQREILVDFKRFGILRDDAPEAADVRQWWEPSPMAEKCVVLIVRSGG